MKTIALTAGHSNADPGAIGNGLKEAEVAADLRNIIAGKLEQRGFVPRTDGKGTINLSLADASKIAQLAQIAVELHCNSVVNPQATGVEAISSYGNKQLAKALAKAVADVLGLRLRGEDGWIPESASQHSRLLYVRCGGVILELFFISNPRDVAAYKAKKWLVASAIADVLAREAA